MYRDLIHTPLQQTLIILWVAASAYVGAQLLVSGPGWLWVFSALLAAGLTTLMMGRLGRPWIALVAFAFGLGALLVALDRLGPAAPATFQAAAVLYSLSIWLATFRGLRRPMAQRLAIFLWPQSDTRALRDSVETVIHGTSLAVVLSVLIVPALTGLTGTGVPAAPLPALLAGLLFLWLADRRYRPRWHKYLLSLLGAWGALSVYVDLSGLAQTHTIPLDRPSTGLFLVLYGIALMIPGWRHGTTAATGQWLGTAIMMATLGATHALVLGLLGVPASPAWFALMTLGLASLVLMGANALLSRPWLASVAVGLLSLSLAWSYGAMWHGTSINGLWPGGPAPGDQWLFVVGLGVAWAVLARRLQSHPIRTGLHPQALLLVAALLGTWGSVGALVRLVMLGLSSDEGLIALDALILVAAALGWWFQSRAWLRVAAALGILFLHGIWWVWLPEASLPSLLPGFALQFALSAWALIRWISWRSTSRAEGAATKTGLLGALANEGAPWLAGLAVLEWLLHLLWLVHAMRAGIAGWALTGTWGGIGALTAGALLCGLGVRQARRSQHPSWVYVTALSVGLLALYVRLLWLGLSPATPWDTTAIMVAAYGLFGLHRISASPPLLRVAMALPFLALLTIPLQLGSAHAGLTFMAMSALYLMTYRTAGVGIPLYLSLLTFNTGIYLWIPHWMERAGLLQLYLVPAALSMLLLVHLHRRELASNVMHGVRLGALSLLYTAATLDVFMQEHLAVFGLALALGLIGILAGIGLRVRAFLYTGVTFLVVNVLGQVLALYPTHRLGKALLLMGVGTAIIAVMVWFNLKRVAILERIRIMRADLAQWE